MKYSIVYAALAHYVSAHGVITAVQGANGVTMPGLSVADGTPRDCASPLCGSESDTSVIRTREMGSGKASPLGRTANGPVDASKAIATFMGGAGASTASTGKGAAAAGKGAAGKKATGQKATSNNQKREPQLAALLGGGKGAGKGAGAAGAGAGQKTAKGTKEDGVSKAAGTGADQGLPTTSDDGTITMTFHQVNQDGAGPLTAQIDATSGGTDASAFKDAEVTQNVPGIGIGGLSAAQTMDFPVKVQMPAGMTCEGSAGGADKLCVVRLQNSALAGPFGGSAAFTQSAGARKRAVEYNLRKRHIARGVLGKAE